MSEKQQDRGTNTERKCGGFWVFFPFFDLKFIILTISHRWLYPGTVEVLRNGSWKSCLSYKFGTEEELDRREETLESGQQIEALFCELPSNILSCSPNLPRIRILADNYDFIVACHDSRGFCELRCNSLC
jgi:hypothetical protein